MKLVLEGTPEEIAEALTRLGGLVQLAPAQPMRKDPFLYDPREAPVAPPIDTIRFHPNTGGGYLVEEDYGDGMKVYRFEREYLWPNGTSSLTTQ